MTTTYQQMQQPQQPQQPYMPPQYQAMPPTQDALPWEVTPADATISTYQARVAAGIPQSMPQYGPNLLAAHPEVMPQASAQPATQAAPQAPRARKDVRPGNYTCALADIREGTTKSGMPRISIAWRILPGQGDMSGLWIWDNVTLGTQKGYEILALKLAHICPGWVHQDTADMYDEARQVRGWAHGHEYSVEYVAQENGFFRVYADLIR